MTHLLDTCICISLIRSESKYTRQRFEDFEIGDLVISAITEAELRFGADKSHDPAKNHKLLNQLFLALPVLAFDNKAALEYGDIRATLEKSGNSIGLMDLLIAAHCRAKQLTLVTANTREFDRVENLTVENWL